MDERTAKRKAVRALKSIVKAAREYTEAEEILAQAERQRGATGNGTGTTCPPIPRKGADE